MAVEDTLVDVLTQLATVVHHVSRVAHAAVAALQVLARSVLARPRVLGALVDICKIYRSQFIEVFIILTAEHGFGPLILIRTVRKTKKIFEKLRIGAV